MTDWLPRRLLPLAIAFAGLVLLAFALLHGQSLAAEEAAPPVERGLSSASDPELPRSLVVRYKPGTSQGAIARIEQELGVVQKQAAAASGLMVLKLADSADVASTLNGLLASGLVAEAAPDLTVTAFDVPNDPGYPRQWHLHNTSGGIRVEAAWGLAAARGSGVVVAVIDTGAAYEAHSRPGLFGTATFAQAPDLAGVPIVAPWNYVHDDSHANDDHGHGTHVAGTILQSTNNGIGMAGVAGQTSLMPIKVLDFSGQGQGSDLVEGIYYAVDHGADIISMSLGFGGTGAPDAEGRVCSEIVGLAGALDYADAQGVTVIAATGNEGASTVSCPAAYPTVIAVGATRYDGQVTFYSNTGDGIDVTAPGGDPNVDQNGDGFADGVLQQSYCLDPFLLLFTGAYTQFCDVYNAGTSMATPHVAGVAALLLGESSALTPAQIRYYLETTARDRGPGGWDTQYGHGLVDAAGALALLKGSPVPVFTPTPTPSVSPTAQPTFTPTATPTPVPAAPTNLIAMLTGVTTIKLSWTDNATDEQYYRVERSADGSSWIQVALLLPGASEWTNSLLATDTTYFYRVRASAGTAYSPYSNTAQATTGSAPEAPSGLGVTATTDTTVTLAWTDNSTDEQYFRVERSTDGVSYQQVAVLTANNTTWSNSGLPPATTYLYRVRASVETVYSAYSNAVVATTLPAAPPPSAPTTLVVTPQSADGLRLSWVDTASNEQYFRVERSLDGVSFAQVAILGANSTSWTNAGLAAATTYFYRVRASTGTVYSEYSNIAAGTTNAPPSAPSGLNLAVLGPDSIRLGWTDNSADEQYFRVERSLDGTNFTQVAVLGANATSWTNSSLAPSATYFYRVRASAGLVYSAYSNVASGTTNSPPNAPSGLSLAVLGPDSMRLTWNDNSTDEQFFRIERSLDGATFSQVAVLGANATSWTNPGLAPSTTYHYRVRVSTGTAYSAYSNVATEVTAPPPAAPSSLTVVAASPTSARLTWTDNAAGEQYYRVERSTDGVTFVQVAVLLANSTTWTNSSLVPDTTYSYRVRASVGAVYSEYSNAVVFSTEAP